MKKYISRWIIGLTLTVLGSASSEEPKTDTRNMEGIISIPADPESTNFERVTVLHPKGWRIRKAATTDGFVIEGPHYYESAGKIGRFGVIVARGPHPKTDIDSFVKGMTELLEKQEAHLKSKLRLQLRLPDGSEPEISLNEVGKFSTKRVLRNGNPTYNLVANSVIQTNKELSLKTTRSMFFVGEKSLWVVSITYPQKDAERFEEFSKWVIDELNIDTVEQGGADQPATAPESKPEGKEKPKPESEARCQ